MFHVPEYYHNLSLKLSEVLNDIGVNETNVIKRRQTILLEETMRSFRDFDTTVFHFGSLSEGTTTSGLNSDFDTLNCKHKVNVIQDYADWQPGLCNLLMVKDENTPPGYCQLQVIRQDLPLPYVYVDNEHCVKVSNDRVLLKNTFIKSSYRNEHGPADVAIGAPGVRDVDYVIAYPCKLLPKEAHPWFQRESANIWPTQEIKEYAGKSYCFVVPVGSKVGQNEVLEWRISTSLAERCLMFSLNITQIRCYILLKMIAKTYLDSHISSFMCKTALLHCIENTQSNLWTEFNLMKCLTHCLQRLYINLVEGNCPHFIIPGNNLMAKKFSVHIKTKLQEILCHITQNIGHALLNIQIDDLGRRLQIQQLLHPVQSDHLSNYEVSLVYLLSSIWSISKTTCRLVCSILFESLHFSECMEQRLLQHLQMFTIVHRNGNILEKTATYLLAPPICSTLGSIKASLDLQTNNRVSSEALHWLHAGLNSDVCSGRLKLASVLYSMGDMMSTEAILKDMNRNNDWEAVKQTCSCYRMAQPYNLTSQYAEEVSWKDIVYCIRENTAFCVRFTPAEINCIPHELKYEIFRSTRDDLLYPDMIRDHLIDWAVVDSLPYLFFLQYKTYGKLQRPDDQHQALNNLTLSIADITLGHAETALNLLGQCMEEENRIEDALQCYTHSLCIRSRCNAAKIHICKLLAKIVNHVQF